VTRDDLPDGGAGLFAETIRAIRRRSSHCRIEVLVPDFQGSSSSLTAVLEARPDVLNHNIETVPSLYARVRPHASYGRSLRLLAAAKEQGCTTKSGLMLGLGEGMEEVRSLLRDLRTAGCDLLTIGQYLRPHLRALPVSAYYHPDEFAALRIEALGMGFHGVSAGPLVRSSYRAAEHARN
jgi:lipoic acid synthetase